jgi:competence ComEA-like helix-hairpin-helix protein
MQQRTLPKLTRSFFSLFLISSLAIFMLAACVKLPRRFLHVSGQTAPIVSRTGAPLIDINTASTEELEKLPGIGQGLAARIIAFRKEYGRFRRTEHLMMVRGISTRRFNAMRELIKAE